MTQTTTFKIAPAPRVAVLGDSVIAGLGARGRSYARLTATELESSKLLQLARSTHTVHHALAALDRVREFEPDLVMVSVGGSDAIVHAGLTMQRLLDRFAPKSWQGIEGLEPSLKFESTRRQRIRLRITTLIKLVVKHVGIRLTGGYRRVELPEFSSQFADLAAGLAGLGCPVVVVGLHQADARYWPRTNESLDSYNEVMEALVAQYDSLLYVNPRPMLDGWDDYAVDRIHFSEQGHSKIKDGIVALLDVQPGPVASPDSARDFTAY